MYLPPDGQPVSDGRYGKRRSYTVCQYYGIETSANSLGYIATWSKDKTLPELKASLETISKTANILITSISDSRLFLCQND